MKFSKLTRVTADENDEALSTASPFTGKEHRFLGVGCTSTLPFTVNKDRGPPPLGLRKGSNDGLDFFT